MSSYPSAITIARSGPLKGLNPVMAFWSKFIVLALILFGALWADIASWLFTAIKDWMVTSLKWYYLASVAGFLFFALWLMFSRYGDVRLGDDDERPQFSYFSWFAMLFSAGMGIGLVFWSIAEPIYHFQSNPFMPDSLARTPEAAGIAMRLTFFHWGLHPWGVFAVTGLALAYFSYRWGLPLTVRSALYPLIGERIYGPLGHVADVLAVLATVFGVATSLGLGVQQMATGLYELTGSTLFVDQVVKDGVVTSTPNLTAMLVLIAVISAIATLSVVSGVGRGVKLLSELNIWLSIIILAFLLAFGPTRYLLNLLLQVTGDYLAEVIPLGLWSDANQDRPWQGSWTAFYWGWWISWAPFVGMFIARISRGRTVREFILGVLLVPTLVTFVWLVAFGGTALHIELFGNGGIAEVVASDLTRALYVTFAKMDLGWLGGAASLVATLLIATYFITSADSATLVVTTLLAAGDAEPPTVHRALWGMGEGVVAAVLLLVGGLGALQTASITSALPFSVVMLLMCVGLVKALRQEPLRYRPASVGTA